MDKLKTLIVQASPGIGDMAWRIPFIHAIARARPQDEITLLTSGKFKPHVWLQADPVFKDIIYIEKREILGKTFEIRRQKFDRCWVLHHSSTHAAVMRFAGIPERFGLGLKNQAYFLNGVRPLGSSWKNHHFMKQALEVLRRHKIPVCEEDYSLKVCAARKNTLRKRHSSLQKPWVCFGIGASAGFKKWPLPHFVELARALHRAHGASIFLVGSKKEHPEAAWVHAELLKEGVPSQCVTDLPLDGVCSFLSLCDAYIGNDTSLLNFSALLSKPTFGIFGATPALTYRPNIYPLLPEDGRDRVKGMASITPAMVLDEVSQKGLFSAPSSAAISS